ncbi:MAG: hypothetical protein ACLU37_02720 [Collinsella sp.]
MAEQLSLFGSPEPKQALKARPLGRAGQARVRPEPVAAYASVVLDIPTRALSEPFAYGIPVPCQRGADRIHGRSILVTVLPRAISSTLRLSWRPAGNNALDLSRIKPIEAILSKPLFTAEAARIARWMSREYVATLSECLRLFLPPGETRAWSRA